MTSIKLTVTGAQAWASVTGPLTSGMVGIPITIEYDEAWEGLTKNLMCRCSPWGSSEGEKRAILNVGENAVVAHEVMQPDMCLYLGVEGFNSDGTLVMPTTWARCGIIEYGANTCEDPSTDLELPIWNQLQVEMEQTKKYVLTPEQAINIQSYAQTATQAAQEASQAAEDAKQAVESGLYYTPVVSQPTDTTLKFEFKPSLTGAPIPKPVTVELPICNDSGDNVTLSAAQAAALDGMFKVCAFDDSKDVSGAYAAFREAFGLDSSDDSTEKPLTGISAAYSGGSVPLGTAVTALTGVVVTATYDDGSTATVTGYTLSGTIEEGENTVSVTYQGMTAAFTVTGVASESGSEAAPTENPFDAATWSTGILYYENNVYGTLQEQANDDYSYTDLVDVSGYSSIVYEDTAGTLKSASVIFYDADKNYIPCLVTGYFGKDNATYPSPLVIPISENGIYVRLNLKTSYLDGTEIYAT